MNPVAHHEFSYQNRRVVLDTCLISGGVYETMAFYRASGKELDCVQTHSLPEARAAHAAMLQKFTGSPAPLSGKYQKLSQDLRDAAAYAIELARSVEDGGTCNFDAPVLFLPRWKKDLVRRAAEEAGVGCSEWESFGPGRFVFTLRIFAQAARRTAAAEAMSRFLKDAGYQASMYYQMD